MCESILMIYGILLYGLIDCSPIRKPLWQSRTVFVRLQHLKSLTEYRPNFNISYLLKLLSPASVYSPLSSTVYSQSSNYIEVFDYSFGPAAEQRINSNQLFFCQLGVYFIVIEGFSRY